MFEFLKPKTSHQDGALTDRGGSIDRNEKERDFTGTPRRMSSSGDSHSHGHGSKLGMFSHRMGCSKHGHQSFRDIDDRVGEGAFGA